MINVIEIIEKCINDFHNDFDGGNITCKFLLNFDSASVNYNTNLMSTHQCYRIPVIFNGLFIEINKYIRRGYNFVDISHLTIKIKTTIGAMTKSNYLKQKKSMLEWTLLKNGYSSYLLNGE